VRGRRRARRPRRGGGVRRVPSIYAASTKRRDGSGESVTAREPRTGSQAAGPTARATLGPISLLAEKGSTTPARPCSRRNPAGDEVLDAKGLSAKVATSGRYATVAEHRTSPTRATGSGTCRQAVLARKTPAGGRRAAPAVFDQGPGPAGVGRARSGSLPSERTSSRCDHHDHQSRRGGGRSHQMGPTA